MSYKKLTGEFTVIPNEIIYSKDMCFKTKGLWVYLNSKPDGWDFSSYRIVRETKESIDSVKNTLNILVESGYLSRNKLNTGKMEYILRVNPELDNATKGNSHQGEVPPISNTELFSNTEFKEKNEKKETLSCFSFDEFWNQYDKKLSREKAEAKYKKVSEDDRSLIKSTLAAYVLSTPDKKFRKDPCTYLNNKSWNDEIIKPSTKHIPGATKDVSQIQYETEF